MAEFSQELFDNICEQIADGESLRTICKQDDMPSKTTVFRWLAADEKLSDQYARAREAQADSLFDDILHISDAATPDEIACARLRVDSRKWMAGKLRPKVYGDKLDIEAKVKNIISDKPMTAEEWEAEHTGDGD